MEYALLYVGTQHYLFVTVYQTAGEFVTCQLVISCSLYRNGLPRLVVHNDCLDLELWLTAVSKKTDY